MRQTSDTGPLTFLTTKEVADLLRVKERKVYDLAAANAIPHRRITGKILFPKTELMAWIEGTLPAEGASRPAVLTGSHDPLLDWAIRESGCGLATLFNGSRDGLTSFGNGEAALCGLHLPDADGWNIATVAASRLRNAVLIAWATRSRGLILHPDAAASIRSVSDLRGRRIAMRQAGAGAQALFERLLDTEGIDPGEVRPCEGIARTESDAAAAVAAKDADAAIGIEAMARRFNLGFLPLVQECFDLLIDRTAYFMPPVQALLSFARRPVLAKKAAQMGGYDLSDLGAVRWLSP